MACILKFKINNCYHDVAVGVTVGITSIDEIAVEVVVGIREDFDGAAEGATLEVNMGLVDGL